VEKSRFYKHSEKNRYLRGKRMTLIIGARCVDGVVLVSDKKVVDTESNEHTYKNKLYFPVPNTGVVVGAAGLANLFDEFNSKLPLIVQQRLAEIRIKNIESLRRIGEKIEDYEIPPKAPEELKAGQEIKEKEEKPRKKKTGLTQLPYIYSIPDFLDDCRSLIKEICSRDESNGLDVLIAVSVPNQPPDLFHIDFLGSMNRENTCAIGSGAPYWNIFKRKMRTDMTVAETARLFSFVVRCVEELELDKYVGVGDDTPDIKLLGNDGKPYIINLTQDTINSEREFAKNQVNSLRNAILEIPL